MRDAVDDNGIIDTEGFRKFLRACAVSGHFLENYVVTEMIKNASYGEREMKLNFYRDKNQKEIDLIIETDGVLHPFEIKRSASPERKAIKAFGVLEKTDREVGAGGIICMAENQFPIEEGFGKIWVELNAPRSGSGHYTFRKQGFMPLMIPKHEPIKTVYIEKVRQIVESEAKHDEDAE